MSKILNTVGCNSELGAQLTNSEIETLSQIIEYASLYKACGKRSGTTVAPNAVGTGFTAGYDQGKQMKEIELFGDYKFLYEQANKTTFKKKHEVIAECDLNEVSRMLELNIGDITLANDARVKGETMEIISSVALKVNHERYAKFFRLMSHYDCEYKGARKILRKNGKGYSEYSVAFDFAYDNRKIFNIELPLVNSTGRFVRNGSEYLVNLLALNFQDYALGNDDVLKLVHPYEYLIERVLTVSIDKTGSKTLYTKEIFGNMVNYANKDGQLNAVQRRLNDVLNNSKMDYHEVSINSPIMWVDKYSSDYSKHLNSQMIGVFAEYDTMIKVSEENGTFTVPGLDLLTGSTSEPAKRCNVAVGYKVGYINNDLCVIKKSEDLHELSKIFSEYKFSNPGTLRTSSKRDNSCTVPATYNLTTPQTYKKRVRVEYK